jgi:hypothetical protein
VSLAEHLGFVEINRIGQNPQRLVSRLRKTHSAQRVNHMLSSDLHGITEPSLQPNDSSGRAGGQAAVTRVIIQAAHAIS